MSPISHKLALTGVNSCHWQHIGVMLSLSSILRLQLAGITFYCDISHLFFNHYTRVISYYFNPFGPRLHSDQPEFCIPLNSFFIVFSLLLKFVVALPGGCGLVKRPMSRDSGSFFLTRLYNSSLFFPHSETGRTTVAVNL